MDKILFVREKRAEKEFATLENHLKQAKDVYTHLAWATKGKGITISMSDIQQRADHSSADILQRYEGVEVAKVKPMIDQFGEDNIVLDGWKEKVDTKVQELKDVLKKCPPIGSGALDYFQYMDIGESGIFIKPEYNLDYFRQQYTVTLKTKEEFEFYEKHKQVCQLLNELIDHPENEFEALDRLFYFNTDTKEFEMDIAAYCPDVHLKIN